MYHAQALGVQHVTKPRQIPTFLKFSLFANECFLSLFGAFFLCCFTGYQQAQKRPLQRQRKELAHGLGFDCYWYPELPLVKEKASEESSSLSY